MASDKKTVLKPGFVLLHHTERKIERQVSSKNKKGLERFEAEGFKKGPLSVIVPPSEAKKA